MVFILPASLCFSLQLKNIPLGLLINTTKYVRISHYTKVSTKKKKLSVKGVKF